MSDKTRLEIDDDWKREAAAEKERLAETVDGGARGEAPAADLLSIVQLLAMQAIVGLGGFAGPGGQQIPPNLELAKHHIDLLEVLEKKTSGNLDADEKRALDTTLHQLRLAYVEAIQAAGSAIGA